MDESLLTPFGTRVEGRFPFKDGQLISPPSDANNSPNWSNAGGAAIAVDGQYIYAA
jgi:hypothetical protein